METPTNTEESTVLEATAPNTPTSKRAAKPAKSRKPADLVYVEGIGTTLPAPVKRTRKPIVLGEVEAEIEATKRTRARKAAPAKPKAGKATTPPAAKAKPKPKPATKATTKAATKAATNGDGTEAALARIRELRADGQSWRLLSATLNDEGVRTVRGKGWSPNGMAAFTLARKHGIV